MDAVTARNKCEKVKNRQSHEPKLYREGLFWQKSLSCNHIDMEQLAKGIEVEMEHTNSNIFATKIALDHLAEYSDYYTALEDMERMLEERKRG